MGASQSVVVIHTSDMQKDVDAISAVFPDKLFQVETAQDATLLVKDQLTVMLVPCKESSGTCAILVLDDKDIRQATCRAKAQGMQVDEDDQLSLIWLPGGAKLSITREAAWKDCSNRSRAANVLRAKLSYDHNAAASTLNGIPRLVTRSISMPDSPSSRSLLTSIPTNPNARLFPSLRVKAQDQNKQCKDFPLNTQAEVPIETDLFRGKLLLILKPPNPQDDPYWNDKIFTKKKRIVVMRLQGKLKYKPQGALYAGMEISKPMNLGLMASGLCNILLKISRKFNKRMHYSFGDSDERPHICFPASTFFEKLVVTPPGETPPSMAEEFEESNESIQNRKAYKTVIDWNTEDTYSMSFHSMYIDFPSWSLVRLPMSKDLSLKTFWGDSSMSVVLYEVDDLKKDRHLTDENKYIVSVQMEYLGKDAAASIDEVSDEDVAKDDDDDLLESGSASISSSVGDVLMSPHQDHEDDADEFFDAIQAPASLLGLDISPKTPHFTLLHVIDRSCLCWIDMISKRRTFTTVYVFQGNNPQSQPIFRTWSTSTAYLGEGEWSEWDGFFSHRLAPAEKKRRMLGIRYAEAVAGKVSPSRLVEFQKLTSPYDDRFLQRDIPSSKGLSDSMKAGFVARAVSDRHWIEELCVLTDRGIEFCHTDKGKPSFRIGAESIVSVDKIEADSIPGFGSFRFLSIQTFGRTTYLMCRSMKERDSWVTRIKQIFPSVSEVNSSRSTSLTNHLINVDDPTEEFLHKSSMWECGKRRVLNCRTFSFNTRSKENRPCALGLAEDALLRATGLQPKGPNDTDPIDFLNCSAALKKADAHSLSHEERLAFFLNLYHIMIMHAFIVLGRPDSSLKWVTYFNNIAYQCSDDIFSLAELEHNIIRAEMCFPSQFLSRFILPKSQFRFALTQPDFRINFALNCGSLSIPSGAVPVYKPESLQRQLDAVVSVFLDKTVSFSEKSLRDVVITLPRVCQWFSDDFGDGSVSDILKKLRPYLSEEKQATLQDLWNDRKQCYDVRIWNFKFLPYNFECRYLTLLDVQDFK